MKRIISVVITAFIAVSMITPAMADGEITAEEVKALIESGTLLSKQSFKDEILSLPVQNPDNIFENKKLGECIDAENTIIEDIQFDDNGNFKQAIMVSWDKDKNMSWVYADDSVRTDHSVAIGASDKIQAYVQKSIGDWFETMFPTKYLNYEKTAELINRYDLKNITEIRFNSFTMGLAVVADGTKYYVTELASKKPDEWLTDHDEQMREASKKHSEEVEKKRAVTPPEYQKWLQYFGYDDELPDSVIEKTLYLPQYENSEPRFSDLGGGALLIQATAMLNDKGIISGYEDGTFRPNGTITRGEASAILAKLVKGDFISGYEFPDVQNHWSRDAVNYLTSANVIHGYEDGTFRPDTPITYEQAITLVYSVLGFNANFYDEDKTLTMMGRGVLNGLDSFIPENPIPRGDFAMLAANAYDTVIMTAAADFTSDEPIFFWDNLDITLGMYLSGTEPENHVFFPSYEGYKEWEDGLRDKFYEIYKDI